MTDYRTNIKAVFFDIDGTLVSLKTHKINQTAIDAIEQLHNRGVKIFISTGRPKPIINNIKTLEDMGIISGYVTMNGAYCILNNKVIYKQPLDKHEVKIISDYCDENDIACVFVEEDRLFICKPNDVSTHLMNNIIKVGEIEQSTFEHSTNQDIYQITPFITEEHERELKIKLNNSEITRWLPVFADITCKGIDKRNGVQKISEMLNIPQSEIMAFGDGGNDISMLSYAGLSVAMGQSSDEVKKHSTYVTSTPEDDGIYKAFKYFNMI